MSLNSTSLAPAVGSSVLNVQFTPAAQNVPRKILVAGTHLSSSPGVAEGIPVQVFSSADAGSQFGFGSMIERLVYQAFLGGNGVPVFVLPQAEPGGASAAGGSVDFTGSAGVQAGTLYLFVANNLVSVNLMLGMTPTAIALAVVAACAANKMLHASALVDGVIPGKVDFTSKSAGPWGNGITLAFNLQYGQTLPAGVVAAVTAMSGGAGVPVLATALNNLGIGDNGNEAYYTDMVHGYGQDSTTLNAIQAYVGDGNSATGLYAATVARPFRALTGDTGAGSTGLTNLITLANGRLTDLANGVVAVPGSMSHPSEIAALAIGEMAAIAQNAVAQNYLGIVLVGIDPGIQANRWTSLYDNRNTAVSEGISPTLVVNGVVTLQSMVTFYRPANVPVTSNGYRSMRNIAIIQNMLYNVWLNFAQQKWQGCSIVADCSNVTSSADRVKARDINSVIGDLIALAYGFQGKAWIYEAAFTISQLKLPGAVTIRAGGLGFNSILPVIFSGECGIIDNQVQFDISLAAITG